jgi:hypothetical protein
MVKFLLAAVLFAASGASAQHAHHQQGAKPAVAIGGVNSLDVYRDGKTIHILVGEVEGEKATLWHSRSADGKDFTEPVRVDAGMPAPRAFRRGDDAQVAARGNIVFALWTVPGTGWGGSGPFAVAISRDGGKTWARGASPSDSGLTTGHGYADLMFDARGLHAVWLDGRDKAQGLRYALLKDGTRWSANQTIAPGTCECCWNSLASRGNETLVLYRAKEPRDMALVAGAGGMWVRRSTVGSFGWEVKGCPETGGALATTSGALHALSWTGKEGSMGLHYLRSDDGGAVWAKPVRLGGEKGQHGDLAASAHLLAAAWDEGDGVWFAMSLDGGNWGKPSRLTAPGITATHPRVVPLAEAFLVLWTERRGKGPWTLGRALISK